MTLGLVLCLQRCPCVTTPCDCRAVVCSGALDHASDVIADGVMCSLDAVTEEQASRAIERSRAADAREGVQPSQSHAHATSDKYRHRSHGDVASHKAGAPRARTPASDDSIGSFSGQRDLALAVVSAVKAAVGVVCKQLGGVHIQRCERPMCCCHSECVQRYLLTAILLMAFHLVLLGGRADTPPDSS